MRHPNVPLKFTLIGRDEEGREYVQCTRTGDVLVQKGEEEWTHFATAGEWRRRTGARLYPELLPLQRTLKRVGSHEEIEDQVGELAASLLLLEGLERTIRARMEFLAARGAERASATVGSFG